MIIDPHNMVGPYALDALDADERIDFEAHLVECPACRDEADGFVATATRLGDAAAAPVPEHLKAAVMASVARTPQRRSVVASLDERRGLRRALPKVFATAAALAVIALGTLTAVEYNSNQDGQAQMGAVEQVIAAPDAQMATEQLQGGATASTITSAGLDQAVVVVKDLPRLQSGRVYQLWAIKGGAPYSVGLLDVGKGTTSKLLGDVSDVQAVAITDEPEGGSKQPTTAPIAKIGV